MEKIERSKYNKWYSRIKGKGIPLYLKKGWQEERWQRVARYWMESEMRGNRYWVKGEKEDVGCVEERRRHGSIYGRSVQIGR